MSIKTIFIFSVALFLFACTTQSGHDILVKDKSELDAAIKSAEPGHTIVLANGVWNDLQLEFTGIGTAGQPIEIRAETPGKVFIEGQSCIKFGGAFLVVRGLHFRNGYTPDDAVVAFKLGKQVANHCAFTECVIENFNQPQRDRQDHWVEFWGRHNELSNCNIIGKSNSGPTIRVQIKGNESIKNYHRIVNNHFGPRPRKGGPHGETIQIGDSGTSMSPSNTLVANNLFDRCNGEVEVISSKSNFNEFRNNVFYKCEGSLVMRHGNYCIVDGNYFIGDDNSENIGGIRVVNTGHWVTNNYFYKLKGNNFRSALAVMNGIPKSPLNRYNQVTDVVVAYNTWIDCRSPWQFGVGANLDQSEVLPASEIRSARAVRTTVANNIVYTSDSLSAPLIAYDKTDGVQFESNIINQKKLADDNASVFGFCDFSLSEVVDGIYAPSSEVSEVDIFQGFDFETITNDILGNSREGNNQIGAMCKGQVSDPDILNTEKYGASWFPAGKEDYVPVGIQVAEGDDLAQKIEAAKNGDRIELAPGVYEISTPLNISKKLVLTSFNADDKAKIVYSGEAGTPLFQMNPWGNLSIEGLVLEGNNDNYVFAPLQKNMKSYYLLHVNDCHISAFNYVLKAYKESFADSIAFINSTISDCENGIELSAETDDNGDYNVEFLSVEGCSFQNVKANVIDYYRGGYDESTIGGNLLVKDSEFSRCGAHEKTGVLINTRGIVNVDLSGNTFKNNPVKRVAVLWGAKNNTHSNNTITNSGSIEVQQNIKLKLMY